MDDDLIRLGDLPESGSSMTELTTGLESGSFSETACSRDFLPRRVRGWRQA